MPSLTEPIRVAVAMSGGVDSAAAAALLVDQGYAVTGLTARMWREGSRCCSLADVKQARAVCWFLGIQHYVINALGPFGCCVAERFAAEYVRGRTPSPCVVCNQVVKFGLLLTRAVQIGCSYLASGHYARKEQADDGLWQLWKARDATRDQSYFLHRLSQRQLAHALFPLGELRKKEEVLKYVQDRGLPLTRREESRDICFAPKGRHHEVVEQFFPAAARGGPIVDTSGRQLTFHTPQFAVTPGQAAVLYNGHEILGGGWISPPENDVETVGTEA